MDVLLCRRDVGDQAVDDPLVIGQQFQPIAGQRRKVAQMFREQRGLLKPRRQIRRREGAAEKTFADGSQRV